MFWGADQEEFCSYVTDLDAQQATPAQIAPTYRKRGDAENVFDELKNQRGFSGFCSGKGVVGETAARLLRWLASIAPQLDTQQTFERYLCWLNPLNPGDWLPKTAP